jgi:hypothetical protein
LYARTASSVKAHPLCLSTALTTILMPAAGSTAAPIRNVRHILAAELFIAPPRAMIRWGYSLSQSEHQLRARLAIAIILLCSASFLRGPQEAWGKRQALAARTQTFLNEQ